MNKSNNTDKVRKLKNMELITFRFKRIHLHKAYLYGLLSDKFEGLEKSFYNIQVIDFVIM